MLFTEKCEQLSNPGRPESNRVTPPSSGLVTSGHLQRADPFRTPNRSDLVRMGQSADRQSGFVRMGRGVQPAARRKFFF
jgi:hypothetical protein